MCRYDAVAMTQRRQRQRCSSSRPPLKTVTAFPSCRRRRRRPSKVTFPLAAAALMAFLFVCSAGPVFAVAATDERGDVVARAAPRQQRQTSSFLSTAAAAAARPLNSPLDDSFARGGDGDDDDDADDDANPTDQEAYDDDSLDGDNVHARAAARQQSWMTSVLSTAARSPRTAATGDDEEASDDEYDYDSDADGDYITSSSPVQSSRTSYFFRALTPRLLQNFNLNPDKKPNRCRGWTDDWTDDWYDMCEEWFDLYGPDSGYDPDAPTSSPSERPTEVPTAHPTASPSSAPSVTPTGTPSGRPSGVRSGTPSGTPSAQPTERPTHAPTTGAPTGAPTEAPTRDPTGMPSDAPSDAPSGVPSSSRPTHAPTSLPTTASPVSTETGTTATTTSVPLSTFQMDLLVEDASRRRRRRRLLDTNDMLLATIQLHLQGEYASRGFPVQGLILQLTPLEDEPIDDSMYVKRSTITGSVDFDSESAAAAAAVPTSLQLNQATQDAFDGAKGDAFLDNLRNTGDPLLASASVLSVSHDDSGISDTDNDNVVNDPSSPDGDRGGVDAKAKNDDDGDDTASTAIIGAAAGAAALGLSMIAIFGFLMIRNKRNNHRNQMERNAWKSPKSATTDDISPSSFASKKNYFKYDDEDQRDGAMDDPDSSFDCSDYSFSEAGYSTAHNQSSLIGDPRMRLSAHPDDNTIDEGSEYDTLDGQTIDESLANMSALDEVRFNNVLQLEEGLGDANVGGPMNEGDKRSRAGTTVTQIEFKNVWHDDGRKTTRSKRKVRGGGGDRGGGKDRDGGGGRSSSNATYNPSTLRDVITSQVAVHDVYGGPSSSRDANSTSHDAVSGVEDSLIYSVPSTSGDEGMGGAFTLEILSGIHDDNEHPPPPSDCSTTDSLARECVDAAKESMLGPMKQDDEGYAKEEEEEVDAEIELIKSALADSSSARMQVGSPTDAAVFDSNLTTTPIKHAHDASSVEESSDLSHIKPSQLGRTFEYDDDDDADDVDSSYSCSTGIKTPRKNDDDASPRGITGEGEKAEQPFSVSSSSYTTSVEGRLKELYDQATSSVDERLKELYEQDDEADDENGNDSQRREPKGRSEM